MYRRRVLAALSTALLPAAGCAANAPDPDGATTTTARSGPDTDTPAPTPTPRTTTEECGWPTLCAGSTLLELFLDVDYDHPVTLRLDCRSDPVTVDPGRYHAVVREVDGEECAVTVSADGETLYETFVSKSETVTVSVDETGEVDVERAVL